MTSKLLFLISLTIVFFVGCNAEQRSKQLLPPNIAGDWKADDSPWLITFDEQGQVVSAVHHMTGTLIKPHETTISPFDQTKVSGEQVYSCGPWVTQYDQSTRELELNIQIDYKTRDCPALIMGSIDEILIGKFDGTFSVWEVDWYNVVNFVISEPITGKSTEMLTSEEDKYKGKLIFRKLKN